MKAALLGIAAFAYENFAPLIVFWIAKPALGLKAAIAISTVAGLLDLAWRKKNGRRVQSLYLFSLVVTLVFGAVDLFSTNPFIFKYESTATNLLTAGFFGLTLVHGTPLIQQLAQSSIGPERANRPDVHQYLRFLTAVWTLYFVVKAAVYAYVSASCSLEAAMAFRAAVGTPSTIALVVGERLVRRPVVALLRRLGWMDPAPVAPPAPAPASASA